MRAVLVGALMWALPLAACLLQASIALAKDVCIDNVVQITGLGFSRTPDGKYYYDSGYQTEIFKVVDAKTGEIIEIPKQRDEHLMYADGKFLVFRADPSLSSAAAAVEYFRRNPISILDIKTRSRRPVTGKLPHKGELYDIVRAEGSSVILRDPRGRNTTIGMDHGEGVNSYYRDEPGSPTVRWNMNTGKVIVEPLEGAPIEVEQENLRGESNQIVSPDNRFVLLVGGTLGGGVLVDLKTRQTRAIPTSSTLTVSTNSGSAPHLSYNEKTKQFLLRDRWGLGTRFIQAETGEVRNASTTPSVSSAHFNRQGDLCEVRYHWESGDTQGKSQRRCTPAGRTPVDVWENLDTPANSMPTFMDDEAMSVGISSGSQWQTALHLRLKECFKASVGVDCDCQVEKPSDASSNLEDLKSVVLATACTSPFDSKAWDRITTAQGPNLSEGQAVTWLKRFSKPGGYDPKKHREIAHGILTSGIPKSYPGLVRATMNVLLNQDHGLHRNLLKSAPELKTLRGNPDFSCLTSQEKSLATIQAFSDTKAAIKKVRKFDEARDIAVQNRDLFTEQQKEEVAGAVGDRMTEIGAMGNQGTEGVFASKIYKFAEYRMMKEMGLDAKSITDFTVVRTPHELRVLQLGTETFGGAKPTDAGVFIREMGRIPTDSIRSDERIERYKWKYGNQEFVGEMQIDRVPFDESHIPNRPSPNYQELWADKEFRGVVIAGSNLGASLTQSTMNQYKYYYMRQGFRFDPVQDNADIAGYLKEKVQGKGQMDYFIKEAHSGGDEKTMMDIPEKGKVHIGRRKVGDREEVIELIYPESDNHKRVPLTNTDFGAWVREREKKGGSELLYLNTSCWSDQKAIYEIPSARSSKYVNIPTTTGITTFVDSENNIMRALVDGIRQEKTYPEIREILKKNPEYASGKDNQIIFPDEPRYQERIVSRVRTPIEINAKVMVKGPDGQLQPYNLGVQ